MGSVVSGDAGWGMKPGDIATLPNGLGRVVAVDGSWMDVEPGVPGPGGSWRPYGAVRRICVHTALRGEWRTGEVARAVALRQAGASLGEVARLLGRPVSSVRYHVRKWEGGA